MRLGPLTQKRFQEFSPNSIQLRRLFDLVRTYVGPQYDVDVQVVLRREDVVTAKLNDPTRGSLGWNTWVGDWPHATDADEPIFELRE